MFTLWVLVINELGTGCPSSSIKSNSGFKVGFDLIKKLRDKDLQAARSPELGFGTTGGLQKFKKKNH